MQAPHFLVLILLAVAPAHAGDNRFFGLSPPRGTPQLFEPALFAPLLPEPNMLVTVLAFTPDFDRCVFSVVDARDPGRVSMQVYETRQRNGKWSIPVALERLTAGGHSAGEGIFDREGRWFYYSSSRPPGEPGLAPRIFRAAVLPEGLGLPEYVRIEPPSGGTFYPRPLADGSLAFTAPGPVGRDDLFVAPPRGAGYAAPRVLAGGFSTPQDDWDLIETSDGKKRIWVSSRPGTKGRTDLWLSRRHADGQWSTAVDLVVLNSADYETATQLSPDDEALFFLSRRSSVERLYWVDARDVLDERE